MKNGVIFCDKRTGSTFLQEALNSHPQIVCYDEMFMKIKNRKRRGQVLFKAMKNEQGMNVQKYINWLYEQEKNKSTLFRLMYVHNKNFKVLPVIKQMKLPIIHLVRENGVAKSISKHTKKKGQGETIRIQPEKILQEVKNNEQRIQQYRKELKKYSNHIEIKYDQMFGTTEGDPENIEKYGAFNIVSNQVTYLAPEVCEKICNILEVDYFDMYSHVTKRNPYDLSERISNYDEVKKFFKNKNYGHMV